MRHFYLWMIAAILFICGTNVLTSCKDDDSLDSKPKAGPLAEKLGGTWYSIYEATGTAKSENVGGKDVAYTSVIDIYQFDENGEGTFQRCFFEDDNMNPVMVQGILGFGDFNYSTTADGKVSIALRNKWSQTYPPAWDISYAKDTLTAQGVDGSELKLQQASDVMLETLNSMVDQNGSSSKYSVDEYKPKGVDNSQWMKSLADGRLVADLSLPGSHDACTADGWKNKKLVAELTAKTQDLTIKEQLKVGMRVFDLRPERVFTFSGYELRCSHGIMNTKLLVSDFFQILKDFLTANPSEFCILTVELSATNNKEAWGKEYSKLINSDKFKDMFVNFKPRLTVGELRGHVLMLSRNEYAEKPLGGYCYGWVSDQEFEKQTKGHITGPDGSEAPLWAQDYWGKLTRKGKDEAIVRMLEAAAGRDMTVANPAWVINYTSAYFGLPLSDNYRSNAVNANTVAANWLNDHTGSVGIIYMDFAGMDKSPNSIKTKCYETNGMKLINSIIKQNQK